MAEVSTVKKDFSFLFGRRDVHSILIYGSFVKGDQTPRSDIDVCIVAPLCKDKRGLIGEVYRNLDVFSKKYDVRIFEELPLYIQSRIIQDHEIIHTKDIFELYEYFYFFRKLWDDQAARQRLTADELAQMLG
ncbi:MAG TPA: nucleotidyltransferase domain-containing protein [Candidatus Methanoperedens sp.]